MQGNETDEVGDFDELVNDFGSRSRAMDVRHEVQSIVDDLGISTSLSDSDLDAALRGGAAAPGGEGAGALSEFSFGSDTLSEPPEAPPQSPPNFAKLRLASALPTAPDLPVLAVLKQEVYRLRSELDEA